MIQYASKRARPASIETWSSARGTDCTDWWGPPREAPIPAEDVQGRLILQPLDVARCFSDACDLRLFCFQGIGLPEWSKDKTKDPKEQKQVSGCGACQLVALLERVLGGKKRKKNWRAQLSSVFGHNSWSSRWQVRPKRQICCAHYRSQIGACLLFCNSVFFVTWQTWFTSTLRLQSTWFLGMSLSKCMSGNCISKLWALGSKRWDLQKLLVTRSDERAPQFLDERSWKEESFTKDPLNSPVAFIETTVRQRNSIQWYSGDIYIVLYSQ